MFIVEITKCYLQPLYSYQKMNKAIFSMSFGISKQWRMYGSSGAPVLHPAQKKACFKLMPMADYVLQGHLQPMSNCLQVGRLHTQVTCPSIDHHNASPSTAQFCDVASVTLTQITLFNTTNPKNMDSHRNQKSNCTKAILLHDNVHSPTHKAGFQHMYTTFWFCYNLSFEQLFSHTSCPCFQELISPTNSESKHKIKWKIAFYIKGNCY